MSFLCYENMEDRYRRFEEVKIVVFGVASTKESILQNSITWEETELNTKGMRGSSTLSTEKDES